MHHTNILPYLTLLLFSSASTANAQTWQPLFNGKDLSGWHTQPGGSWTVEEGIIVGRSPTSEPRHGLLVTDGEYQNFVLRVKFRVTKATQGFTFALKKPKLMSPFVASKRKSTEPALSEDSTKPPCEHG